MALDYPPSLLSQEERSAIAEIEATTNILRLVTRLTNMRFAAITKFGDAELVICSVHDSADLGIGAGEAFPLEDTICSEFQRNPAPLLIPRVSHDQSFASRLIVKTYDLDSYVGVPIFLPDGRLYGALCAIDSRPVLFEDPDVCETLEIFARLIGCIFFASLAVKVESAAIELE